MIIIKDKINSKIPIIKLFKHIFKEMSADKESMKYQITRIGGFGTLSKTLEDALGYEEKVFLSFVELENLIMEEGNELEVLYVTTDYFQFGIVDSSFCYLQCKEKALEEKVCSNFENFKKVYDRKMI